MRNRLHVFARTLILVALGGSFSACAADTSEARPGRLAIPAPSVATKSVEESAAADRATEPVTPAGAAVAGAAVAGVESGSTTPAQALEPVPSAESVLVYVTKTGAKYHRGSCQHLSKSKIPMELAEAKKRYGPCGTCKPPH